MDPPLDVQFIERGLIELIDDAAAQCARRDDTYNLRVITILEKDS